MKSDHEMSNRPIPFRNNERLSDFESKSAGDYADGATHEGGSSQRDPTRPVNVRRPARSGENTPRYRR